MRGRSLSIPPDPVPSACSTAPSPLASGSCKYRQSDSEVIQSGEDTRDRWLGQFCKLAESTGQERSARERKIAEFEYEGSSSRGSLTEAIGSCSISSSSSEFEDAATSTFLRHANYPENYKPGDEYRIVPNGSFAPDDSSEEAQAIFREDFTECGELYGYAYNTKRDGYEPVLLLEHPDSTGDELRIFAFMHLNDVHVPPEADIMELLDETGDGIAKAFRRHADAGVFGPVMWNSDFDWHL